MSPWKRQVHQVVGDRHVIVERLGQADRRVGIAGDACRAGVSMRSSCCSTSRMLLRYSSRMARSGAPSVLPQLRRFPRSPNRAGSASPSGGPARCSVEPVSPNIRSKVTRGLIADRQRAGVVAPGQRVEEGAGEAVAGARRRCPCPRCRLRSSAAACRRPPCRRCTGRRVFFDWILPNASPVPSRVDHRARRRSGTPSWRRGAPTRPTAPSSC